MKGKYQIHGTCVRPKRQQFVGDTLPATGVFSEQSVVFLRASSHHWFPAQGCFLEIEVFGQFLVFHKPIMTTDYADCTDDILYFIRTSKRRTL